jgi:hypothetical protein
MGVQEADVTDQSFLKTTKSARGRTGKVLVLTGDDENAEIAPATKKKGKKRRAGDRDNGEKRLKKQVRPSK